MSILFQPGLRSLTCPAAALMYDWMHCIFVAGVFNRHMGQLMHFIGSYATGHNYMKLFRWPKRVGNASGKHAFTGSRARTNADSHF